MLEVTDNQGAKEAREVMIKAEKPLVTPIATIKVTPQEGSAPLTVSLDGSESRDPDGEIINYEWIFSDGTKLTGVNQSRVFDMPGVYRVSLKVRDDDSLENQSEEVSIKVTEQNLAPIMSGDQSFDVLQNKKATFTLNGGEDPEGEVLSYSLVNPPRSGTLTGCLGGTGKLDCQYLPTDDFVGEDIFSYRANDGVRDSATVSVVRLSVRPYNKRPVAQAGMNQNVDFGSLIVLDGSASYDPEGEEVTYYWTIESAPMGSRAKLAGVGSARPKIIVDRDGVFVLKLVVNDGKLDSPPTRVSLTVKGQKNKPPALMSITSPQSLELGSELRLFLQGSDEDGDELSFSGEGMPSSSRLDGVSGEFRFNPSADQTGDHKVTFSVSDGRAISTQEVTIRVMAPAKNQVTTLTSRVLDANAYSAGQIVPIVGVRVTVEGSSVETSSDTQGYFTLKGISNGAKIVSLNASGLKDSQNRAYANFEGRLKILPNVHNRPYRDYMLPTVDPKGMAMVERDKATMLENTDLGVRMMIPANTAMNRDGSMYEGEISVSMVPIDATPRELPEEFRPSVLLTLQPTGIRFNRPVDISFPNRDNLEAGTLTELFSLSEKGGFEKVGTGIVSKDGKRINLLNGGIQTTTWHFITITVPVFKGFKKIGSGSKNDNNSNRNGCSGSRLCLSSGMLEEEYSFSSFQAGGKQVSQKLGYTNSSQLTVETFMAHYEFKTIRVPVGRSGRVVNIVPMPSSRMRLSFSGRGIPSKHLTFNTNNIEGTEPFSLGGVLNTQGYKTGMYKLESRLELVDGTESSPSMRMKKDSDYLPVISPVSEFGRGWRWQEISRLYGTDNELNGNSSRVMLLFGNFKYLIFSRNEDGSYTSPNGDYSTLSYLPSPVNSFIRTMKSGERHFFNSDGFLLGKVDRYERKTKYRYDEKKRIKSIEYPGEMVTKFIYGENGFIKSVENPGGKITNFTHDFTGNIISISNPALEDQQFEYGKGHTLVSQVDGRENVKSYAFDNEGNVVGSVRTDGSAIGVNSQITRLIGGEDLEAMAGNEQKGSYTDARGYTSSFELNDFGSIVKRTDNLGQMEETKRDENNNIIEIVDQLGRVTTQKFDSFGNLLERVTPVGKISYRYPSNPAESFHQPLEVTDERGNKTSFEYDSFGNITSIRDAQGSLTEMSYRKGYLLSSSINSAEGTGRYYVYDGEDNLSEVRDLFNQRLAGYTYDVRGNVLTQTDGKGNITSFAYDNLNRLITQTDARGGVTNFAYDQTGNLTSVQDARGKTTRFEYDSMRRLTKKIDPLGMEELFYYDGNGNLVERRDRNGRVIGYEYDALNRLIRIKFSDGSERTYAYDPVGNVLAANNQNTSLGFVYDEANRAIQTSIKGSANLPSLELYSEYDKIGNRTLVWDSLTKRKGANFYEYDKLNNLIKVTKGEAEVNFSYDRLYRRESVSYPNGVEGVMSYVPQKINQLKKIAYDLGRSEVSSFDYSYDRNDNVTEFKISRGDLSDALSYTYDKINQLIAIDGSEDTSYVYDSVGNRLRQGDESSDSTFNDNNQLLRDKILAYTYDDNGNLTKTVNLLTGEITEYTWDDENRLTKVLKKQNEMSSPHTLVSYLYDALGRRVQKEVNGEIVNYVYDGNHIRLELSEHSEVLAQYTHSDRLDEVLLMEREKSPYANKTYPVQEFAYHRDRLGNITEITDFAGKVVQRYSYGTFGEIKVYDDTGTPITHTSPKYLKSPYGFGGAMYEPSTGLYHHRRRDRDPSTNRWLSPDPIGFGGGDSNLYGYVFNNPINLTDPTGEGPIGCLVGGAAGGLFDIYKAIQEALEDAKRTEERLGNLRGQACDNPDEALEKDIKRLEELRKVQQRFIIRAIRANLTGVGTIVGTIVGCAFSPF